METLKIHVEDIVVIGTPRKRIIYPIFTERIYTEVPHETPILSPFQYALPPTYSYNLILTRPMALL